MWYGYGGTAQQQHCGAVTTAHPTERVETREL